MLLQMYTRKNNRIKKSNAMKRTLLKTLSWRVIGTLDTVFISWLLTGKLALAFSIGSIELVTKMILYFFHERIWENVKWGKQKQ